MWSLSNNYLYKNSIFYMNSFSSLEMIMQLFNVQKEWSLLKNWLIIWYCEHNFAQCNIHDNHCNVGELNFQECFKNCLFMNVNSTFLFNSMTNLHILKAGFVKHFTNSQEISLNAIALDSVIVFHVTSMMMHFFNISLKEISEGGN